MFLICLGVFFCVVYGCVVCVWEGICLLLNLLIVFDLVLLWYVMLILLCVLLVLLLSLFLLLLLVIVCDLYIDYVFVVLLFGGYVVVVVLFEFVMGLLFDWFGWWLIVLMSVVLFVFGLFGCVMVVDICVFFGCWLM